MSTHRPWSLIVSVLTSQVSFVLKHVRDVPPTAALPVLHPPSAPPSSAISLSLMPSMRALKCKLG